MYICVYILAKICIIIIIIIMIIKHMVLYYSMV